MDPFNRPGVAGAVLPHPVYMDGGRRHEYTGAISYRLSSVSKVAIYLMNLGAGAGQASVEHWGASYSPKYLHACIQDTE